MSLETRIDATETSLLMHAQMMKDMNAEERKEFNDMAVSLIYLKAWRYHQRKTFQISDGLIDSLSLTDVPKDFSMDSLHFPFECFCLENESGLVRDNEVISKYDMASTYTHIFVMTVGAITQYKNACAADNLAPMNIDFGGNDFVIMLVTKSRLAGELYDYVFFPFRYGMTLEDAMTKANYSQFTRMNEVINLIINSMLYISDPTRKPDSEEMRKKSVLTHPDNKGKHRFTKYDCIYLRPPKTSYSHHKDGGRHLDKRFMVRGHWRNQAYGKRHVERRHIWIRPHWKGDSLAEIINKPYKVEA
jgi:hypothetical protein